MSEKITCRLTAMFLLLVLFMTGTALAHDDDYIVGLSAYRDGLYDISLPALEAYLQGDTEERKADYAHYLLYRVYLSKGEYKKSAVHIKVLEGVRDRRFDMLRMKRDKMLILTKTDCGQASEYVADTADEVSVNYYLDSECKPEPKTAEILINKTESDEIKLKIVSKFADRPEVVASVFDSLDRNSLDDNSKKYFALYFYKNGDKERFQSVRAVYEDADIVGLELDSLWKSGDRDGFIAGYEKYRDKYKLTGANICRAIDVYKKAGKDFDCNLVNECMQTYSVDFVKLKGACLVKEGDKDKVTVFINSLKPKIFSGMCGYGEYIFHNDLYTGKQHSKFYQCKEKYKIADILLKKKEFQPVVNMFFKKSKDMDRYFVATALRSLGKVKAADGVAAKIQDANLKAKYHGGS